METIAHAKVLGQQGAWQGQRTEQRPNARVASEKFCTPQHHTMQGLTSFRRSSVLTLRAEGKDLKGLIRITIRRLLWQQWVGGRVN